MEIKIYRHKTEKDIYLARNWHIVGGGPDTDFYFATKDFFRAIKDANTPEFINWTKWDWHLKARITLTTDVNIDGYTGTLKKEVSYPVEDFELVTFAERED